MTAGNRTIIERPMEYNLWRAPTDNDRNIRLEWQKCGYDRTVSRAYETKITHKDNTVVIRSIVSITALYLQRILDIECEWRVDSKGRVNAKMKIRNPVIPYPRGLGCALPARADESHRIFGYGPHESYIDKRRASYMGLFAKTIEECHEDYINHRKTEATTVANGLRYTGLRAAA